MPIPNRRYAGKPVAANYAEALKQLYSADRGVNPHAASICEVAEAYLAALELIDELEQYRAGREFEDAVKAEASIRGR